jgi:hypothetical protein
LNFISQINKPKSNSDFGHEYPKVDAWMKENCHSKTVQAAINIASMKSKIFDSKVSIGTRYWLRSSDHSRLILEVGLNAVKGYQQGGGDEVNTSMTDARASMACSLRTKVRIIKGGLALGRLRKKRSSNDKRTWVLYPSGQQLIEFINFQLYFYKWAKDADLVFSGKFINDEDALFSEITASGQGISFLAEGK